jgi:hypothetical protein
MAVGWFENGPGFQEPLAARWNGSSWTLETPPPIQGATGAAVLDGVSCASASLCVAVGGISANGDTAQSELSPFAEVWDGTGWAVQSTPNPPAGSGGSWLSSVSCVTTTACIAVGEDIQGATTRALTERWDGKSWTSLGGVSGGLDSISCTSMTSCVAVGSYINAFNGTSWTAENIPKTAVGTLTGVSCASQTACTAVGNDGGRAIVERLTGTVWIAQASPPATPPNDLAAVSCSTMSNCTAVGSPAVSANTYVQEWDGTTWTAETTPSLAGAPSTYGGSLDGVSCTSPGACIAVGGWHPAGYADPSFRLPLIEQEP